MNRVSLFASSVLLFIGASLVNAENYYKYYPYEKNYEITITNITKNVAFTPILAAAHNSSIGFFDLGAPASSEIAAIAESGNIAPLKAVLEDNPGLAGNNTSSAGLLEAGSSVTLTLSTTREFPRLSLAAMLLPTNDTFVALDSVHFPRRGTKTVYAEAYDAGSETNDEVCASIPGPTCGGAGPSPDDEGEGHVHISAGIHGEGELKASAYDWRGPVAKVEITRVW